MNIEYDSDFRIYIFSHLSNPHFSPEVQQLGKVLNFCVTREGLEQQLLQIICRHELSKEEEDREQEMHRMIAATCIRKCTVCCGLKSRKSF